MHSNGKILKLRKSSYLLVISITLFLSACNSNHENGFNCIPALNNFSYTANQLTNDRPTPTLVPMENNS
jgi:hypothetical protein